MARHALALAAVAVAAGLALTGCGDPVYPVRLAVRLPDGEPAVGCSVIIQREGSPALLGGGRIGADGSCAPFIAGQTAPGLPAGTYRMAVTADSGPPTDGGGRKPLPFAARFTSVEESGLRIEVGPGRESAVTVTLEP